MNSLKKGEGVPLLNFEGGPGVPLLNFEGCSGSQEPGPTFTPCRRWFQSAKTRKMAASAIWLVADY